jgi:hypothetical protein
MKLVYSLLLFVFASSVESLIMNCVFKEDHFGLDFGLLYTADCSTIKTGNPMFIEEIRGDHLLSGNDNRVHALKESGTLEFIPTNLVDFFPNLIVFYCSAPLKKLSASDLEPFPNLIVFSSIDSEFTSIDGNLFQHTRKLQIVEFSGGKLQNVGKNLLSDLSELKSLKFAKNQCINFIAETQETIQEMEDKLVKDCPPLTVMETTKVISTFENRQCNVRCSLDSEIDRINDALIKQIVINEELRKRIAQYLERVIKLEKKPCPPRF